MDERVLEAQRWVNATYGGVPGFTRAPENGRTGWPTMFALTRALQHELGLTPLSDNFGPATLSALTGRGDVGRGETNKNIVKIFQSACYCKGYEPGGITGNFGTSTVNALRDVLHNMGLSSGGEVKVTPKLFKAMLTMDAYVLLADGTESIRRIQQWLNIKYTKRRDFFIIPCDGIFSRDVQKSLYLAIQFELGMTDDEATGIFGPQTRAGLRAHPLSEADQSGGIWVELFSAAVVFNRVRLANGDIYSVFTNFFSPGLTTAVREFQKFSQLPVNGTADFVTWCQLLVSTGDPDRPGTACDGITTITDARAQALKAAGYSIVGRYLDERPSSKPLNKQLQPGELATIFRNGLKVFPISQYWGEEVSYFSYSQGYQDALGAHAAAVRYGFNTGTVIYFAVDYDATQDEIDSHIIPYFNGVVGGLASQGKKYVHGVYGSRNVCAEITRRTYARWSFVSSMSYGFSGNMGFPLPENWAFNQIQTLTIGSGSGRIEIDKNVYRVGTDPAVSSVNDPGSPIDALVNYIKVLYNLAVSHGGNRNPSQLVMEFLRHEDYSNSQWEALIGDLDGGFVTFAKSAGVQMVREVKDPFYGVDLKVSHLGASCNGMFVRGQASGTTTNRGDVTDWGGDWMTFYGEWRRDSDSYPSGYTYCDAKLAKVDGAGTFKLRDLIEDADAYNLAMMVRGGTNIADAVTTYYQGGGYLSRMKQFFQGRFGNASNAKAIAKHMLLPGDDLTINAGRIYLIQTTGGVATLMPHLLPEDKLDEFCQGFSDMLLVRVGQENARVAALRAQDSKDHRQRPLQSRRHAAATTESGHKLPRHLKEQA